MRLRRRGVRGLFQSSPEQRVRRGAHVNMACHVALLDWTSKPKEFVRLGNSEVTWQRLAMPNAAEFSDGESVAEHEA